MKLNLSVLFALLAALILNSAAIAADDTENQAALAKAQEALSDAEGKVQSLLNTTAMAADDAEYQAALAKAQETLSDAEGKVQLWSTSEILLNDAEEAAAAGDFELAVKLATEARLQGELAVATAEREKKTWQNHVPK